MRFIVPANLLGLPAITVPVSGLNHFRITRVIRKILGKKEKRKKKKKQKQNLKTPPNYSTEYEIHNFCPKLFIFILD